MVPPRSLAIFVARDANHHTKATVKTLIQKPSFCRLGRLAVKSVLNVPAISAKQNAITIDGEDARDFDDAISLTKDGENYNLSVYIADVSHYVKQGSKIDQEAFKRATSVYFPDHVLPMLPVELSNGICSLNPNVDRLVQSVLFAIDRDGNIVSSSIHKGVINSKARLVYSEVTKFLDNPLI